MYFYIFFLVLDDSGDVNDLVAEEDGDKIENTANEIPKDDQKPSRKKNGEENFEDYDYDDGDIDNTAAAIPINDKKPPR